MDLSERSSSSSESPPSLLRRSPSRSPRSSTRRVSRVTFGFAAVLAITTIFYALQMPMNNDPSMLLYHRELSSSRSYHHDSTTASLYERPMMTTTTHGDNETMTTTRNNNHWNNEPNSTVINSTINSSSFVYRGPSLESSNTSFLQSLHHNSTRLLPRWMTDYIEWHRRTKAQLTPDNYQDHTNYLILRCLRHLDPKCGGASDRLKLIPFALLVAHQTRRLLLIQWTRPHALEEFLVPPTHGIDWRVPDWMNVPYQRVTILNTLQVVERVVNSSHAVSRKAFVDMRHQSNDYGMSYYNEHAKQNGELSFDQVYRDMWQLVFEPSRAVRNAITSHALLQQSTQAPQDYISLHIRTLYARNASAHKEIIQNAVHCAYQMAYNESLVDPLTQRATAIFIATDSLASTRAAVAYANQYFKRVEGRVGTATDAAERHPLHLDRGMDFLNSRGRVEHPEAYWHLHPPSDFYDVFEDLYLLAGAKCHVYGLGGFGRWGAALSQNSSCVYNHAVRNRYCPVPKLQPVMDVATPARYAVDVD